MSADDLRKLTEQLQSWSEEDRAELLELARFIEARRAGHYVMTAEEEAAVREGLEQADRGEFASEQEVLALRAMYRK